MATPDFVKAALLKQYPQYHPYHVTLQVTENLVRLVQNQNRKLKICPDMDMCNCPSPVEELAPIYFCPVRGLLSIGDAKHWGSMHVCTSTSLSVFFEMLIHSEAISIPEDDDTFVINARDYLNQQDGPESSKVEKLFEYLGFRRSQDCPITGEAVWTLASDTSSSPRHKLQPNTEIVVRHVKGSNPTE
jgi:hypothetical protein